MFSHGVSSYKSVYGVLFQVFKWSNNSTLSYRPLLKNFYNLPALSTITQRFLSKVSIKLPYIKEIIFDLKLREHDQNHSCTTLIINQAYDFEWVPLNCNRVFEKVNFMCEFESEIHRTFDQTHVEFSRLYCPLLYIFINNVCILLVHESVNTHEIEEHNQGNIMFKNIYVVKSVLVSCTNKRDPRIRHNLSYLKYIVFNI